MIIVTKGAFCGRRKGTPAVWHAVAGEEINGADMRPALCGAQPSFHSYGWTTYGEPVVTCPKCKKANGS